MIDQNTAGKIPLMVAQQVASVQRWHMVSMRERESLATHSYLVTMNCLRLLASIEELARLGGGSSSSVDLDWVKVERHLVHAALLHDVPEVEMSDVSTFSKQDIKAINNCSEVFEKLETNFFDQHDISFASLFEDTHQIDKTLSLIILSVIDSFQALVVYLQHGDPRLYISGRNIDIPLRLENLFRDKLNKLCAFLEKHKIVTCGSTLKIEFNTLIKALKE